jgi:UDP-glucose 4-epimerase
MSFRSLGDAMNRILVTGGFGFLGSHLVEALVADDRNQVHVVDRLSSNPVPLDELLDELGRPPNLSFTIEDVRNFAVETSMVFDEIYHLASVVGPAGVIPHASMIVRSVVDSTYAVMDLARRCAARLLDVSTSEVYGGGQGGYCKETFDKIIPARTSARLEYAVAKLAAETALLNACTVSELDAVIIRPFNISGPRQSGVGGFVLPRFVSLALRDQPLTVFGDGRQLRAFTHVTDTVAGLILGMRYGRRGQAYNIGNPENKCSILDLALEVLEVAGSRSEVAFIDPKTVYGPLYEEANEKFPDAAKARIELGWIPKMNRRRTIESTVDYFRAIPPSLFERLAGDPVRPAAHSATSSRGHGSHV